MKTKVLLILIILFYCHSVPAQQKSVYYGVQTHFGQFSGRPDVDSLHVEMMLDSIKSAGIKIIRDECYWSEIEKSRGIYSFPKYADDFIKSARKRGLDVLLILDYNNPLYAKHAGAAMLTDSNRIAYSEYCKRVVLRYSPLGVKYYELWNEPNIPQFWDPAPDASEYTKLLKAAYPAIRQVDSTVTILGCATSPAEGNPAPFISWLTFIGQVRSSGGLNYMDGLSFHMYRVDKSPDIHLLSDINNLKAIIGENKQIWISEIGYPTSSVWPNLSQQGQAVYVSKLYLLGRTVDQLKLISYYDLKNDGSSSSDNEQNFGLLNYNLAPKPAFTAYKTVIKEIGDKPLTDKSIQGSLFKLTFGNLNERTYALWNYTGAVSKTESFNKNWLRVSSMLGEISYIYDKDKSASIDYINEPKFITETDSVPAVNSLEFISPMDTLVAGQKFSYRIMGYTEKQEKITIDSYGADWSFTSSLGRADSTGQLYATSPGTGTLTASFGGKKVLRQVVILPSYKYFIMEAFNSLSNLSCSFSGMLPQAAVSVIDTAVSLSGKSLLVSYAFQYLSKTKHKVTFLGDYQMPGEPDSVLIDIYNDGNGHVLNIEVADRDGKTYSVSSASDSLLGAKGWRTIRLPLTGFGTSYSFPARFKKLTVYTLKTGAVVDSIYNGIILLDNLRIHGNLTTKVNKDNHSAVKEYLLEQNYPNPFNPSTTIAYQVPSLSHVRLMVYDLLGREVITLVNKEQAAGRYSVGFDGSSLPSGTYIYSIEAGSFRDSKKLLLIK